MEGRRGWASEDDKEYEKQLPEGMGRARAEKAAKKAAATPAAMTAGQRLAALEKKTADQRLAALEKKTQLLAEASEQMSQGRLQPQLIQDMFPAAAVSSTPPLPETTIDLSKLPIIWTYQDAGAYGESLGETVGRVTKWAAHRNPLRRQNISTINTAENDRPIRIEFTRDVGEFRKGQSIPLNDKNAVIQFIRDNYAGLVGGGKRRKRKSHRRKSHRRKSHRRKSHKRKSHKRKSHRRKSHKRKITRRRR